jgi:hypothetical protein
MKGETVMAQKEPWTHAISDRLMDAQVIAKEQAQPDPRLLDALHDVQVTITDVHKQITDKYSALLDVANVIRYGAPRQLRATNDTLDAA